jgi:predicted metal-binding membrane protein
MRDACDALDMTARRVQQSVLLLAAALVTWILVVWRMRGMDAGPGTDLGGFGWYLGVWVTMMAAMMLPAVTPMVLLFDKVSAERARRGRAFVPTWVFASSYLAVWTVYGIAAYGLYRAVAALDLGFLGWDRGGPYVVAALLVLAGVYELTPLKSVCLRHCRSPMHFVLGGWRNGVGGAVRMGAEHGAYCVGCCWGLMVVLFGLGVMSIAWMAVVAVLIFAQKALPFGGSLPRVFAAAFAAVGLWIAVSPGSVPGLTEPDSPAAAHARMRMMHDESQAGMQRMPSDMQKDGGSSGMSP